MTSIYPNTDVSRYITSVYKFMFGQMEVIFFRTERVYGTEGVYGDGESLDNIDHRNPCEKESQLFLLSSFSSLVSLELIQFIQMKILC